MLIRNIYVYINVSLKFVVFDDAIGTALAFFLVIVILIVRCVYDLVAEFKNLAIFLSISLNVS